MTNVVHRDFTERKPLPAPNSDFWHGYAVFIEHWIDSSIVTPLSVRRGVIGVRFPNELRTIRGMPK